MDKKTENWIRTRLVDANRICAEVRLEHIAADGEVTLDSFRIDPDKDKEAQLQRLVSQFSETVDGHAAEFPRQQRYSVVALADGDRVIASQTFRVKPPSDLVNAGETEPANAAGIIGLQLRAAESLMRMLLMSVAAQTENQSKAVEQAYARIATLEEQRMGDFDAREQLMGKAHERALEQIVAERGEDRKDRLFKRVEQVVAPLVPDILGKMKILPPASERTSSKADSNVKAQIKALAQSFDESQQDVLAKILRPEQAAILYALMGDDAQPEPDKSGDKPKE